jgi:poly(hydroxyalkanoate) granule-associated protein
MSKQIKVTRPVKARVKTPGDSAQRFWLASLGAVSITQKLGAEWIDNMVSEGKTFQARTSKVAKKTSAEVKSLLAARVQPLKQRLQSVRREAEARFEHGVGRTLSYLGVPSKSDVDALIARVDKLSKQLRASR